MMDTEKIRQLKESLRASLEAMEQAADTVVRESEAAQVEAAEALVQSYQEEGAELIRLLDAADREDEENAKAEELEKAGKMPE
ncbi:MAG TPA: hypothetical protein VMU12_00300 [Candidatus Paceibacterota bacterium]|nr:hypothetical protein [Candidatus Paceibacterota bacterium]